MFFAHVPSLACPSLYHNTTLCTPPVPSRAGFELFPRKLYLPFFCSNQCLCCANGSILPTIAKAGWCHLGRRSTSAPYQYFVLFSRSCEYCSFSTLTAKQLLCVFLKVLVTFSTCSFCPENKWHAQAQTHQMGGSGAVGRRGGGGGHQVSDRPQPLINRFRAQSRYV